MSDFIKPITEPRWTFKDGARVQYTGRLNQPDAYRVRIAGAWYRVDKTPDYSVCDDAWISAALDNHSVVEC